MDTQRGHTGRRRLLLMLGAPLVLAGAGWGVAAAMAGDEDPERRIRTDPEPLNARFAEYTGELTGAHWQAYDIDDHGDRLALPSPDPRIRLVGIARLRPGGARKAMGDGSTFLAAAPQDPPGLLKPHLPADAQWQRSAHFDTLVAESDAKTSGTSEICLDAQRDLMYFDLLTVG
nr:hypothetical protein OG409_32750 [Streptomyces sp. NBC_00974]